MTKSIAAIYENGVFRPLGPVDLPDHTPVAVIPNLAARSGDGLRRSAGAWRDGGDSMDAWLSQLEQMRHNDRSVFPCDSRTSNR
jgi:predicted DNA-binding antitoxin AbrB/MazE fold protein